jgi:hypothetical protein
MTSRPSFDDQLTNPRRMLLERTAAELAGRCDGRGWVLGEMPCLQNSGKILVPGLRLPTTEPVRSDT